MRWRECKRRRMMILICIGIIVSVFTADLIIKNKVEESKNLPRTAGRGLFVLKRYHNKGAMLNLGGKKPKLVAILSVVLSVLALGILIFSFGSHGNNLLRIGLSLLLGGAFSNTYDRLRRKYVVDYLSFSVKYKSLAGVVYNISDFCIMIGALLGCIGWLNCGKGI